MALVLNRTEVGEKFCLRKTHVTSNKAAINDDYMR